MAALIALVLGQMAINTATTPPLLPKSEPVGGLLPHLCPGSGQCMQLACCWSPCMESNPAHSPRPGILGLTPCTGSRAHVPGQTWCAESETAQSLGLCNPQPAAWGQIRHAGSHPFHSPRSAMPAAKPQTCYVGSYLAFSPRPAMLQWACCSIPDPLCHIRPAVQGWT